MEAKTMIDISFGLSIIIIFISAALMFVMLEKQLPKPFPFWVYAVWGIGCLVLIWGALKLYFYGWDASIPVVQTILELFVLFVIALIFLGPAFDKVEQMRAQEKDETPHIYNGDDLLRIASTKSEAINSFVTNGLSLAEMVEKLAGIAKVKSDG